MKSLQLQILVGVVYLALLFFILPRSFPERHQPSFADDAAYVDLAAARTMAESGGHGLLGEQPIPATRNALWRVLLAAASFTRMNLGHLSILVGSVAGLVLITVLVLGTGAWLGRPAGLLAGFLTAVIGGTVAAVAEGQGAPLASLLVTAAVLLHVRGTQAEASPLPTWSALLLGFAATLRIELALIWLVFVVHSFLMGWLDRAQEPAPVYRLCKGLAGVFVMLCCLAPQIAWNVFTIGVPWPRSADSAVTLDALQQGQRVGFDLDRVMVLLRDLPPFDLRLFALALALGYIVLLVDLARRKAPASISILLLLPVIPVLLALAAPVTGWFGAHAALYSLVPLWCVTAAYGLARVADMALDAWGRRFDRKVCAVLGFVLPVALAAPLLALGAVNEIRDAAVRRAQVAERHAARSALAGVVRADARPLVLTDMPGWLAYGKRWPTIDLRGEASPAMLAFIAADGKLDPVRVSGYLRSRKPAWYLLAGSAPAWLLDVLSCREAVEVAGGRVCALTWEADLPPGGT